MVVRLASAYHKFLTFARARGKTLGYLFSIGAFAYLALLVIYGGVQLKSIRWENYLSPLFRALFIHLVSQIVQYFIWTRLLVDHHRSGWQDVAIYSRMLMLRRLPGGVWHWLGRTTMYADATQVPAKIAGIANFIEWALLILTAGGLAAFGAQSLPIVLRVTIGSFSLALGIWIGYAWQAPGRATIYRMLDSIAWIALYAFAWWLGGVVILGFASASGAPPTFNLAESTWVWALGGGGSMIMVFVPAGLGIRELSLTWLLEPYLPPAVALSVALLVRFTYTIGDFLYGTLGWLVSTRQLRKTTPRNDPVDKKLP